MVQRLDLLSDARQAACLTGLRALADANLRDVLPRIDVPTLLLYGEARTFLQATR